MLTKKMSEIREHYHHGALKEVLVKEAFAVLEERGIEELSLRDLAERIGVSKNAPYRHFPSKSDLLTVLAIDGFNEFADAIEAAVSNANHHTAGQDERQQALQALREAALAFIGFSQRRPACYRLMFSRLGYTLHSESCKNSSMRAFDAMSALIAQAHKSGWRNDKTPTVIGLQIWATLHGWAGILNDHLLPKHLQDQAAVPIDELLFGAEDC